MQTEPESERVEIRKYANRRYYDKTHSRHLTLEGIRTMVHQGQDVRVTDGRTKADITAQVLTQIILELDSDKLNSFPVPLLARVIRMNDQLVKDFIEKYFNQALHSFLDYQRQVEEQIRRAHGLPTAFPSVSAWTKAVFEPLASAFSTPAAPQGQAHPTQPGLNEKVRQLEEELAVLKRAPQRPPQKRSRKTPKT